MRVISGTDYILKMSAAVPRMYRKKFGKDIIVGMDDMYERLHSQDDKSFLGEELEMLENLIYICHKHADESQPEDVEIWMSQFSVDAIYDTIPTIIDMWNENLKRTSTAKKKTENQ